MKTVKEIDKQIQKEHDYIVQLYAQINSYEQSVEHLKAERQDAEKKENEMFIDNWLNEHFGIQNQKEARQKSIFIVFDKNANFVKTVTTGYGEDFRYVSPVEDEDTMEYWLRKTNCTLIELRHSAIETEIGTICLLKISLKIYVGNLIRMEN